ncbi:MAG TPA: GTPase Era [Candidatus Acidoferrum sp.]|nr:GTPase Era [Candidatus Acidoferrum sp.]
MNDVPSQRCGLVALVGRPNVGKSTLLNHLVGQKVSITSRKPQTTRHRVLGIKTAGSNQLVFVDTPGYHLGIRKTLNRLMNRTVSSTLLDVDVVLFVTDRLQLGEEDTALLQQLQRLQCPVLLVINKTDELADREALLPFIEATTREWALFREVVPVSALKDHNLAELEATIVRYLPEQPWFYPEDQLTDRNARFLAAEFVREKIVRQMGDELPYETAVEIEEFREEGSLFHISAVILVEKETQKKMLIGEGGSRLKLIGTEARKEMERMFDCKVMLKLWVKVKSGWSDDERALRSLGLE